MGPSKDREILDDETLMQDGKNRHHDRTQLIQNVKTYILIAVMILIPLFVLIMTILVLWHYFQNEKWEAIEKIFFGLLGVVAGIIIAELKKHGVGKK